MTLPPFKIDPEVGIVYGARGRPLRKTCGGGYLQVNSTKLGAQMMHRVIWEYVHGEIPDGMQVNHINGIKTDNRIVNLELVTANQNMKHAYRTGLCAATGESNGRAKLTVCDVIEIRKSYNAGEAISSLSKQFKVSYTTVFSIIQRKTWGHI